MSDSLNTVEQPTVVPERRAQLRQSIRSLAYVDLGFGNGGIILNVSESGLAVRSVTPLMETSVPKINFRPSATKPAIEVGGEIVWKSEANTMVGIRFLELPEGSRQQIREWIAIEAAPVDPSAPRARYSFEARPPKPVVASSASVDMLTDIPKAFGAPRESRADSMQSVIPIRVPDAASGELTAPLAPLSVLSIDAPESSLPLAGEEFAAEQPPPWKQSPRRTAGVVALFAALSLAAGWAVGRGILNRSSAPNRPGTSEGAPLGADPDAGASVGNFAIEVVDSNDRRWLVPINGPSKPLPSQYRPYSEPQPQSGAPGNSASKATPSSGSPALRIWTLSAPIVAGESSRQPSADSGQPLSAPPNIDVREPPAPALRATTPNLVAPALRASTGYRDGRLIHRVDPIYPDLAKQLHIEGVVKLKLDVATDGKVSQVQVVGGPKLLLQAAVAAVKQWRYEPSLLDGKPTEAEKDIDVQFNLPR